LRIEIYEEHRIIDVSVWMQASYKTKVTKHLKTVFIKRLQKCFKTF